MDYHIFIPAPFVRTASYIKNNGAIAFAVMIALSYLNYLQKKKQPNKEKDSIKLEYIK